MTNDGYVVQWRRSSIPSNSLACVYCAGGGKRPSRRVLGSDVDIDLTAVDETNTRIKPKDIIDLIRRHDGFGMVGLVGVQSNQYPRALDIARPLRAAGIPIVIGGFHVSGLLAMLPGAKTDLQVALDLGCSLFAGEAEGRIDQVLKDAAAGALKPVYISWTICRPSSQRRRPTCRATPCSACTTITRASTAGRGCPSSARSAPSSTCRAASRAAARPTIRAADQEALGRRHPPLLHHG